MSNPEWFENKTPPPAGTWCEFQHLNGQWEKAYVVGEDSEKCLVLEFGSSRYLSVEFRPNKFRPIPEVKKINRLAIRAGHTTADFLMVNPSNSTLINTVKNIDYMSAYVPVLDHWNAVKGLTEEPDWIQGYNVELRFRNGAELNPSKYSNWPKVVAIRFDSVKEGWEL